MVPSLVLTSLLSVAHAAPAKKDRPELHGMAVFGAGAQYSGATYTVNEASVSEGAQYGAADKIAPGGEQAGSQGALAMPLGVELRLNRGRLMVSAGLDWSLLGTEDSIAVENRQQSGLSDATSQSDTIRGSYDIGTVSPRFSLGASGILGQDADIGFGPRLGARWTRTGLPRGQQAVAAVGWAIQPPVLESLDPVRPVVDFDVFGGVEIPDSDSIARAASADGTLFPVAGLKANVGLAF